MSSQRKPGPKSIPLATYGKLDTQKAHKQFWLARLNPRLAQLWDDAPEGTLLGHMTFTKGTPKPNPKTPLSQRPKSIPQKIDIVVSQQLEEQLNSDDGTATNSPGRPTKRSKNSAEPIPLNYTITTLTTKIPTLYPFTRQPDSTVSIHGRISRSCNLQMERTQRYRDMCKSRLLNAVAGRDKSHVKPVASSDLSLVNNMKIGSLSSGFGNTIASFKAMEEKKNSMEESNEGDRKRKFDKTIAVRSILFELFHMQSYWSVKELRTASGGRAEKEIKAELSNIAEYKRSGEFKGKWELKKEYRGDGKDGATGPDATGGS